MTTCPQCGYREIPKVSSRNNIMNHYFTSNGLRNTFMNRDDEKFDVTVGEGEKKITTTWIRKDVYDNLIKQNKNSKGPGATSIAAGTASTVKPLPFNAFATSNVTTPKQ